MYGNSVLLKKQNNSYSVKYVSTIKFLKFTAFIFTFNHRNNLLIIIIINQSVIPVIVTAVASTCHQQRCPNVHLCVVIVFTDELSLHIIFVKFNVTFKSHYQ